MGRVGVPGSSKPRVVLIDDDDLFRESIGLNLQDEGFEVLEFSSGAPALNYFSSGERADVILLDWRMPEMDGLEVLRKLREAEIEAPVIFLTVLGDELHEELALERGAVDFIDKSRRLSIVLKRLNLILEREPATRGEGQVDVEDDAQPGPPQPSLQRFGPLELRTDICRAWWRGQQVDLTLTEFHIVRLLVGRAGEDISYREIYDVVHGVDFLAGYGSHGYRANVRALIKRIRKKFRGIDDGFVEIGNYPGYGYRWLARDD